MRRLVIAAITLVAVFVAVNTVFGSGAGTKVCLPAKEGAAIKTPDHPDGESTSASSSSSHSRPTMPRICPKHPTAAEDAEAPIGGTIRGGNRPNNVNHACNIERR